MINPDLSGKKRNLVLGLMLIMLLAFSTNLMADETEPTGDPREVSTLDHLLWISTNSSSWSDDFIQTANIDASATSGWDDGAGFSPIGNSTTNFTGNYNGLNNTINGLTCNHVEINQGMFGLTDGATLQNIALTNVNITGGDYTGGLVGSAVNNNISNCSSTGTVTGTSSDKAGGLIRLLTRFDYNKQQQLLYG